MDDGSDNVVLRQLRQVGGNRKIKTAPGSIERQYASLLAGLDRTNAYLDRIERLQLDAVRAP